jgi:hypothetical protein
MQDTTSSKLVEFNNASDDSWEDLKTGMDSTLKTLGNSLKSASSRFKQAAGYFGSFFWLSLCIYDIQFTL